MTALEDCHLCTINNEENSVNNAFFARKFVPVAQSLQVTERHGYQYEKRFSLQISSGQMNYLPAGLGTMILDYQKRG